MKKRTSSYAEFYRDPRWQKKRLAIMSRDEWTCQDCGDTEDTLHVHHRYYVKGRKPWEYPDEALVTLCASCHKDETERRPAVEAAILLALKKRFLACDLEYLADAIEGGIEVPHVDGVVTSAIGAALSDRKAMSDIVEWYLDRISPTRTETSVVSSSEGS